MSVLTDQLELGGRVIHIRCKSMKNPNEQPFLIVILKSMIHAEELKQILSAFYEFIEQAQNLRYSEEMDYLLPRTHTIKGNFIQCDWMNLVDHVDELEDAIIHKHVNWEEWLSKGIRFSESRARSRSCFLKKRQERYYLRFEKFGISLSSRY